MQIRIILYTSTCNVFGGGIVPSEIPSSIMSSMFPVTNHNIYVTVTHEV